MSDDGATTFSSVGFKHGHSPVQSAVVTSSRCTDKDEMLSSEKSTVRWTGEAIDGCEAADNQNTHA